MSTNSLPNGSLISKAAASRRETESKLKIQSDQWSISEFYEFVDTKILNIFTEVEKITIAHILKLKDQIFFLDNDMVTDCIFLSTKFMGWLEEFIQCDSSDLKSESYQQCRNKLLFLLTFDCCHYLFDRNHFMEQLLKSDDPLVITNLFKVLARSKIFVCLPKPKESRIIQLLFDVIQKYKLNKQWNQNDLDIIYPFLIDMIRGNQTLEIVKMLIDIVTSCELVDNQYHRYYDLVAFISSCANSYLIKEHECLLQILPYIFKYNQISPYDSAYYEQAYYNDNGVGIDNLKYLKSHFGEDLIEKLSMEYYFEWTSDQTRPVRVQYNIVGLLNSLGIKSIAIKTHLDRIYHDLVNSYFLFFKETELEKKITKLLVRLINEYNEFPSDLVPLLYTHFHTNKGIFNMDSGVGARESGGDLYEVFEKYFHLLFGIAVPYNKEFVQERFAELFKMFLDYSLSRRYLNELVLSMGDKLQQLPDFQYYIDTICNQFIFQGTIISSDCLCLIESILKYGSIELIVKYSDKLIQHETLNYPTKIFERFSSVGGIKYIFKIFKYLFELIGDSRIQQDNNNDNNNNNNSDNNNSHVIPDDILSLAIQCENVLFEKLCKLLSQDRSIVTDLFDIIANDKGRVIYLLEKQDTIKFQQLVISHYIQQPYARELIDKLIESSSPSSLAYILMSIRSKINIESELTDAILKSMNTNSHHDRHYLLVDYVQVPETQKVFFEILNIFIANNDHETLAKLHKHLFRSKYYNSKAITPSLFDFSPILKFPKSNINNNDSNNSGDKDNEKVGNHHIDRIEFENYIMVGLLKQSNFDSMEVRLDSLLGILRLFSKENVKEMDWYKLLVQKFSECSYFLKASILDIISDNNISILQSLNESKISGFEKLHKPSVDQVEPMDIPQSTVSSTPLPMLQNSIIQNILKYFFLDKSKRSSITILKLAMVSWQFFNEATKLFGRTKWDITKFPTKLVSQERFSLLSLGLYHIDYSRLERIPYKKVLPTFKQLTSLNIDRSFYHYVTEDMDNLTNIQFSFFISNHAISKLVYSAILNLIQHCHKLVKVSFVINRNNMDEVTNRLTSMISHIFEKNSATLKQLKLKTRLSVDIATTKLLLPLLKLISKFEKSHKGFVFKSDFSISYSSDVEEEFERDHQISFRTFTKYSQYLYLDMWTNLLDSSMINTKRLQGLCIHSNSNTQEDHYMIDNSNLFLTNSPHLHTLEISGEFTLPEPLTKLAEILVRNQTINYLKLQFKQMSLESIVKSTNSFFAIMESNRSVTTLSIKFLKSNISNYISLLDFKNFYTMSTDKRPSCLTLRLRRSFPLKSTMEI
ncbi:hypothetical protein DLAC_07773 [Tieghemostelium lacteum]|uniref:Uncharacterized protein n=1 Tax=Tieghemostelium lacteum TaxID=361077 RepID=A0A151ZAE6_TIELA|nr:hypothetical protein DLAC_07773 [Tieghemostelium lacteum]|eukprot:KYQ90900.1 hypothetical protein DLAC_07773 [Tieghemostelium lacteum]